MPIRPIICVIAIATLSGCAASEPQAPSAPVNTAAPFPLADSRIVGQPAPGAILVEIDAVRGIIPNVRGAAREWCGGAAQVSPVSSDLSALGINRETWMVRCQ